MKSTVLTAAALGYVLILTPVVFFRVFWSLR